MKRLLQLLGLAVTAVLAVAGLRTVRYGAAQAPVARADGTVTPEGAAERLAGAIRIATISSEDPAATDPGTFSELHAYLHDAFPRVHATLRREVVASHSLLYTWQGTDPSRAAILLSAHLDVVPVEPGTEESWQEEPFGGRSSDGFIWGRGAIDDKSAVLGILEAVEMLLADGFQPAPTVYLAFGHDEEVGGTHGAGAIAELLAKRGVQLTMVLDEGGVIGEGVFAGIEEAVALIGIAEKGFVTLELSTRGTGGHSSLPPPETSIGILAAAVARLEESPLPARLTEPTRLLFERIGPRLPLGQRAVFANLWLTRPLVLRTLTTGAATNAMVRTTTAPTIFQAGTKDNVLASSARATVNFRVLPGDSIERVVRHVRRVIDDERVAVELAGRFSAEPSAVSSTDGPGFRGLERAIRSIAPEVIVAPFLVVVVTDARHYSGLGGEVYRFLPVRLGSRDLERIHGSDERLAVDSYADAIRIYRQLLLEAAGPAAGKGT
jgi:carboxypeptidase PM20D1